MENTSYDAIVNTSAADKSTALSPEFSLSNPFLSPTSNASVYSSLFQKYYSPNSPSDAASFDGGDTDRRLHDASCILEYQQLYNRHTLCLAQLRDSIEEIEALRLENDSLRFTNADLSRRVALLFSRDRLFSEISRLNTASTSSAASEPRAPAHLAATQPLNENYRVERRSTTKGVTLPKSISVRSSGYQKTISTSGSDNVCHKSVSQPAAASQQRVCLPGSKKEEALELDVYNQGMWKTELCNKWQETGACPYEHNCQFAHGIKELRPVIRHPRYKTEVCRMVLAGDVCPYGHRCHFRHSLTDQERLVAAQSSR
ncbi:hypothetical protein CASFOL_015380 [Castilleja foliolosa]|uniref:C3H1-type domain-containing protein n=1 Tax=Castilleja foliolosa TaxID=1961234 RepID=A0ABD3DHH9_9LAMI